MEAAFSLFPLRVIFRALDPVRFGRVASNRIRGALGKALRRIACQPDCPGFSGAPALVCPHASTCAYARNFEPSAIGGPSGLAYPPRPYVVRAGHLDQRTIGRGELFHFDLHFFDTGPGGPAAVGFVVRSFQGIADEGLGPLRSRVELIAIERIDQPAAPLSDRPLVLCLDPIAAAPSPIQIEFCSPTELKGVIRVDSLPDFATLFARVRDRIATLRALYGGGALPVDFRDLAGRAAVIKLVFSDIRHIEQHRRSSRTGQRHPLSGFMGTAVYAGDFGHLLPWLHAAQWTGVGRQTVWGKGEIRVRLVP